MITFSHRGADSDDVLARMSHRNAFSAGSRLEADLIDNVVQLDGLKPSSFGFGRM
jgi:hypothetical protein